MRRNSVIPAKAGIQGLGDIQQFWIPVYAGMTAWGGIQWLGDIQQSWIAAFAGMTAWGAERVR